VEVVVRDYEQAAIEWLEKETIVGHLSPSMVVSLVKLIETEVNHALKHAAESAWQAENRPEYP
jgi:hypothetical protein